MKNLSILAVGAICLITNYTIAQSTDLDKKFFPVKYIQLPKKPVLDDINRTYSIKCLNSLVLTQSFPEHYFESEIKLSGFSKLQQDGFLSIESKLIDINILNADVQRKTETKKDKNDKEYTVTTYIGIIKYRTEGSVSIQSADGSIEETFTYNRDREKSSNKFSSYKEASDFLYSNRSKTLRIDFVKEVISEINNFMASQYGYTEINNRNYLWILDSKKHPENEAHQNNFAIVNDVMNNMSFSEPVNGFEEQLVPAISYFESLEQKYPEDDRKSKKLRYASYYNLSVIYYYLDNYDKAISYAKKLIENDFDKSDGKRLEENANDLKNLFEVNKTNTRHLQVITEDKSNYHMTDIAAFDLMSDENKEFNPQEDPNYSISYAIMKNRDTIAGYLNMSTVDNLTITANLYVKDFEGKFVKRALNAQEVDMLFLGNGDKRYTEPFNDATDVLGGDVSHKFVRRLFQSEKMNLYQYHQNELVIKKKGDKRAYSTSSASWVLGFRKKLGDLIEEECPTLAERVKNKEFDNNSESLIEFIKTYEECGME